MGLSLAKAISEILNLPREARVRGKASPTPQDQEVASRTLDPNSELKDQEVMPKT